MNDIKIKDILEYLKKNNYKYNFNGNLDDIINGYSSIKNYKDNSITWFKNEEKIKTLSASSIKNIKLAIVPYDFNNIDIKNYIKVNNPKEVFFNILEEFFGDSNEIFRGENNIISSKANIAVDVSIGNNCIIDDNVIIESGCKIYDNVVIRRGVILGKNCVIKSGTVIGEEGFGYSKNEEGIYKKVPHFGSVKIGNNVDIGSNTCIDKGTIDDTIIEDGVKIDNLCHIAHNVKIGKNSMVIARTQISGSVTIGENCYISTSVIRNQINIGNNVFIGMGSIVTKDIENDNVVKGNSPLRIKYLKDAVDIMLERI